MVGLIHIPPPQAIRCKARDLPSAGRARRDLPDISCTILAQRTLRLRAISKIYQNFELEGVLAYSI